jgi:PKD repeat protein
VTPSPDSITAQTYVPPTYPAGWPVPFGVRATPSSPGAAISFDWDYGDGTVHGTNQFSSHAYVAPGVYSWKVGSAFGTASAQGSGTILIGDAVALGVAQTGAGMTLSWPQTTADALLESTSGFAPVASWLPVTNVITGELSSFGLTLPASGNEFFRLRRPW